MTTIRDIIRRFSESGIEDAKNDALLLVSEVSGRSVAALMFALDDDLTDSPYFERLDELVKRREAREPLQYILGKWSFFGDEYTVSPDCLIPRADTETLVDTVLDIIGGTDAEIADLCCGSGCIGIAVVKNSSSTAFSVDISAPALLIAEKNAKALGVSEKIDLGLCDVLAPDSVKSVFDGKSFDVIASNPPYIRPSDAEMLAPELSYEPSIALFGGEDGMLFYREITQNFLPYLKENGSIVYEIGFDEEADIKKIAAANGLSCRIVTDLEARPRVAVLKRMQSI